MDILLARLRVLAPEPQWKRLWGKLAVSPTMSSLDISLTEGLESVKAELFEAGEATEDFPGVVCGDPGAVGYSVAGGGA